MVQGSRFLVLVPRHPGTQAPSTQHLESRFTFFPLKKIKPSENHSPRINMNKKQRKLKKKRQRMREPACTPPHDHAPVKELANLSHQQMPLWTKTGELYQPVRIYYDIRQSHKVRPLFKKLHCLAFNDTNHCWIWQYTGEAENIEFEKRPVNPAKPVVLGAFVFNGPEHMHLDVHSIERALAAMSFFDTYLSRRIARITHLSIVNRLFSSQKAHAFTFDRCDAANALAEDPIASVLHVLDALQARSYDEHEKMRMIESSLNGKADTLFPEVEHIAIRFSQRKLNQLWFLLGSRQYVAIQHWKGKIRYSNADYIRDMVQGLTSQFLEKHFIRKRRWRNRMLPRIQSILNKWLSL